MTAEREQRIRERAHAIWEDEGRPQGKEREHWRRAEAEIAAAERHSPDAASDGGAVAAAEADAGSTITMSPGGRGRRLRRVDSGAAASSGGGRVAPGRKPKPP